MNSTARTPITNSDVAEIIATLPESTARQFEYMALSAIIDAGRNQTADHSFDTASEIAAYDVAFAATITWMNA